MKRNAVVVVLVIVAVGLMVWAGVTNYQLRQQQAKVRQLQALMATPAAAGAADADDGFEENPLLGKTAPNFTLTDTEGKRVSLSDYKGKAVVVDFWATWCAPCRIEIPWLEQFNTQYAGKGLQILGVSEDNLNLDDKTVLVKEKKDITDKAAQMKINYPVLFDDANVSTPYGGVEALPTTFFIDRSGKVVASTVGLVSRSEIEANIKKALSTGAQS
ncbi:MAG: TlpA disulfide reductase family protein [Acidobacteriaceae bacterium]